MYYAVIKMTTWAILKLWFNWGMFGWLQTVYSFSLKKDEILIIVGFLSKSVIKKVVKVNPIIHPDNEII